MFISLKDQLNKSGTQELLGGLLDDLEEHLDSDYEISNLENDFDQK